MSRIRKDLDNSNYTKSYYSFRKKYQQITEEYLQQKNDTRIRNSNNIMRESWSVLNENKNKGNRVLSSLMQTLMKTYQLKTKLSQ